MNQTMCRTRKRRQLLLSAMAAAILFTGCGQSACMTSCGKEQSRSANGTAYTYKAEGSLGRRVISWHLMKHGKKFTPELVYSAFVKKGELAVRLKKEMSELCA